MAIDDSKVLQRKKWREEKREEKREGKHNCHIPGNFTENLLNELNVFL